MRTVARCAPFSAMTVPVAQCPSGSDAVRDDHDGLPIV